MARQRNGLWIKIVIGSLASLVLTLGGALCAAWNSRGSLATTVDNHGREISRLRDEARGQAKAVEKSLHMIQADVAYMRGRLDALLGPQKERK